MFSIVAMVFSSGLLVGHWAISGNKGRLVLID